MWLAVEVGDLGVAEGSQGVTRFRENKWHATIFEDGATKQFSVSLLVAGTRADSRLEKMARIRPTNWQGTASYEVFPGRGASRALTV